MAMSLRLSGEIAQQLREASAEEGLSMNGAAEVAISERFERRQSGHVLAVADGIVERHARLLSRPGDS